MVGEFKTHMCNLIEELKERHDRQKRFLLTTIKNGRRHLYEHRGTESKNYRGLEARSEENNELTAGIVITRPIFKEDSVKAQKKTSVSFNIPKEENC